MSSLEADADDFAYQQTAEPSKLTPAETPTGGSLPAGFSRPTFGSRRPYSRSDTPAFWKPVGA